MSEMIDLIAAVRVADGRGPDGPPHPDQVSMLLTEYDEASGRLAAVAWRPTPSDPAELYVHPTFRGRGFGRRLAEQVLAEPAGGGQGIWAHGTAPAAQHLAAAAGLRRVRELLQMRAPLPVPAPAASLPAGTVIRTFRPGADDAEFLRVNAAAFAWHPEQGRLSQAELDAEKSQPWFDAEGFFLAVAPDDVEPGGRVLGFHWTKVHAAEPPAEPEPLGEIYVLGVDPDSPVRHLGSPLAAAGLAHLAARGLRQALLYVERDNERAVALYRRLGFREHTIDTVYTR